MQENIKFKMLLTNICRKKAEIVQNKKPYEARDACKYFMV